MGIKGSLFLAIIFFSLPAYCESFFKWFDEKSIFEKKFVHHEKTRPSTFISLNLLESSTPSLNYYSYQLIKNNMPVDLALVPLIESANNPVAESPKHALGLWQFMPNTAKEFGLITKDKKDFRKNVIHSTDVALDYFKYLYNELGDWNLVLIAYNWGIGSVKNKLKHNLIIDGNIDFNKIPRETRNYLVNFYQLKMLINLNSSSSPLSKYPLGHYFKRQPMSEWLQTYKNANSDKTINTKVLERINGFNPFHNNHYDYVLMPTNLFQDFFSIKDSGRRYNAKKKKSCVYLTKYKDSFQSIAFKYKMTVDHLKDLNASIFELRPNLKIRVCN